MRQARVQGRREEGSLVGEDTPAGDKDGRAAEDNRGVVQGVVQDGREEGSQDSQAAGEDSLDQAQARGQEDRVVRTGCVGGNQLVGLRGSQREGSRKERGLQGHLAAERFVVYVSLCWYVVYDICKYRYTVC